MDLEKTYQQTLDYLYTFVDYSLTRGFRNLPGQFDLGRMAEFMHALGDPHRNYPIIHVAGTKGKGSVCAFCASALEQAGYRVGLYTSPHLEDYAERIRFNGEAIPHEDLIALVDEVRPLLDKGTKLTTFEITTGLAFWYFARRGATAVVAEVGLGGRLDATNVVTPLVTVITSISYDHTQVLGSTLGQIATEKAGIIKPGVPLVVAPQKEEAEAVIARVAQERHAPSIWVGRQIGFAPLAHSLQGQKLLVWIEEGENFFAGAELPLPQKIELTIPLLGEHQVENAATAWGALQVAQRLGLACDAAAIQRGFAQVSWPARFEVLHRNPALVVDCAHNRDSAEKLAHTVATYFPKRQVILIFGASEDKDVSGMLEALLPLAKEVIFTRSYHPRAMEAEKLAEIARPYGKLQRVIPTVEEALEVALREVDEGDLVLASGSIFIAAGVRQVWRERVQVHYSR